MARPSTGSITPEPQADGTITFRLRFPAGGVRETVLLHERRACDCGCRGGWTQRTAETELRNIIAKVAAGVWERPRRSAPVPVKRMPTFHEYASYWLQAHKDGVLGEKPLGKASYKDYRWRLSHLLPFFGPFLLDEIDSDLCLEFKAHKLKEGKEIAEAISAGADLRDERNRKIKPIGPSSLKRFLDTLRTILDEAIEDKYILANPAHGRRLKVKVPKPKRTFLERDELIACEDAALSQDPSLADYHRAYREAPPGSSEAAVALALSEGLRQPQVAAHVGLCKATVGFHCKKFGRSAGVYVGRRAMVCTLGRAGVRASELCDIKIGQLVLHGVEGSRFDIPDAKTETGIRKVEMTDDLVEVIIEHIDRLRRVGFDTGPEAPLFPNARGGRMCRQRVGEIVAAAAARDPAHPAPDLHLDRAAGEQIRHQVGDGSGRARRLDDDPGRLREAAETGQSRARRRVRQADARGAHAPVSQRQRDLRGVRGAESRGGFGRSFGRTAQKGPSQAQEEPQRHPRKQLICREDSSRGTAVRIWQNTIFSRVLYQLSYLAADRSSTGEADLTPTARTPPTTPRKSCPARPRSEPAPASPARGARGCSPGGCAAARPGAARPAPARCSRLSTRSARSTRSSRRSPCPWPRCTCPPSPPPLAARRPRRPRTRSPWSAGRARTALGARRCTACA